KGAEQVDPPGQAAERQEVGKKKARHRPEGVTGRVAHAELGRGGDQFTRVLERHVRRERGDINAQGDEKNQAGGDEIRTLKAFRTRRREMAERLIRLDGRGDRRQAHEGDSPLGATRRGETDPRMAIHGTRQIASRTMRPDIFEVPAYRSSNTMGTSSIFQPSRHAM